MSRFAASAVFLAFLVCACFQNHEGKEIVDEVLAVVRETLPASSFEVYDFKVGWYNDMVDPKFKLTYCPDTVALSIQTIPGVFENSFLPFLCEEGLSVANDSWPKFMEFYMEKVQVNLQEILSLDIPEKDILYSDATIRPGHPKVLVQIAADVAGAAYYYQRKDVINDTWPLNETIYGASLHPRYGGWFYMGPVIILECVNYADMPEKLPIDVLVTDEKKIDFLNKANFDWQTQEWRDVIPVEKRYSHDHLEYSLTYGEDRTAWVVEYCQNECCREKMFSF